MDELQDMSLEDAIGTLNYGLPMFRDEIESLRELADILDGVNSVEGARYVVRHYADALEAELIKIVNQLNEIVGGSG